MDMTKITYYENLVKKASEYEYRDNVTTYCLMKIVAVFSTFYVFEQCKVDAVLNAVRATSVYEAHSAVE